jgi:transcriptional regulator with XRE-family HTH domain
MSAATSAAPPPGPRDQSWRQDPRHRPRVNAYARDRYQQQQAGTWAPFTLTEPVREYLDQLREAGMTCEQIARAGGVSVSTLTRAFRVNRISTTAADAILAVQPPAGETGLGPARQLQALVADGWHLEQLADAAGINDRTAWRTVHGYSTPSPRTTAAVDQMYEDLKFEDPGDGTAAVRSRLHAHHLRWTTPASTDVVDDVADDVAVDRVVFGDPSSQLPVLRPQEQQAALRRLAGNVSDDEIARRLGVATRTVIRHRMAQGLSAYAPVPPIDGPGR